MWQKLPLVFCQQCSYIDAAEGETHICKLTMRSPVLLPLASNSVDTLMAWSTHFAVIGTNLGMPEVDPEV